ncbi:hypothetical protein PAT3040_00303 [Paenibacillus agaridevorans]|uniref:Uncharacterized protein n=1 Tax=Paenibacillus agaridevorans TaxID=171404 RepID=A0A2R5ELH4_9BACL|nr:hypothetical protein PAT3040_00303 [Paenibacillus agaridevorans]
MGIVPVHDYRNAYRPVFTETMGSLRRIGGRTIGKYRRKQKKWNKDRCEYDHLYDHFTAWGNKHAIAVCVDDSSILKNKWGVFECIQVAARCSAMGKLYEAAVP